MNKGQETLAQDRALVEAVLARRSGAFETLVERHQRLVWHLVHRVVQHPEDTRELCQEVFLRVHGQLQRFRFESRLSTWIGRIAWHTALRRIERKQLPLVPLDNDTSATLRELADDFNLEAACADTQLHERLHAAIDELPPLRRAILTLYYLDEISIAEVAVIADMPEGTVKSELFRARAQLRKVLAVATGDMS